MTSQPRALFVRFALLWSLLLQGTTSFTIPGSVLLSPNHARLGTSPTTTTTTTLWGRKKRGDLGILAEDGLDTSTTKKSKRTVPKKRTNRINKKTSTSTKKTKSADPAPISPALAEWMANNKEGNDDGPVATTTPSTLNTDDDDDDDDDGVAFETFESKDSKVEKPKANNSRRIKQSERKELDEQRQAKIDVAIKDLEKALEAKPSSLEAIVAAVQRLVALPTSNLRNLVASRKRYDYRLAWVGSDEALCHVGTGLHKVALARMQEVFFSCLGQQQRVEWLEVIRILGPFPNVKNILQGKTNIVKNIRKNDDDDDNSDIQGMEIVMDSMVDGTGKEILAGKEDNIRRVSLEILFCDESAIVASVPKDDQKKPSDPPANHLLVFVREKELDEKLDALRVL